MVVVVVVEVLDPSDEEVVVVVVELVTGILDVIFEIYLFIKNYE